LCFNKETKGFEVVTDAKKEIAKQIKAAIRSQKRTPKIYKVVKNHSFAPIPLIPIEPDQGPDSVAINTTYSVMTLNKEQGIHWIKEERLPAFLESRFYLEYRLGKLISQARVAGEKGEFVLWTIDYKPKTKLRRKKSVEEIPQEDPKERLMKDMFVCLGDTPTSDADAWFSSAQISSRTESTYSTLARPKSAEVSRRPVSARPVSAYSTVEGYRRPESGIGTSIRSSVYSGLNSKMSSYTDHDEDVYSSKLFAVEGKPMIHKPSENIFSVTDDYSGSQGRPFSSTVYTTPRMEPIEVDDESGLDVTDSDSNASKDKQDDVEDDDNVDDENSTAESQDSIVFKNIDDIGAAVVRAILTRSIGQLTNKSDREVLNDEDLLRMLPSSAKSLTVDMLDRISLLEEEEDQKAVEEEKEEEIVDTSKSGKKKDGGGESDADSLLDSEDDYEEGDEFFRKSKQKTHSLTTRKGIEEFKKFLEGTAGERNWHLWLDIDRLRWMYGPDNKVDVQTRQMQIQQHLIFLREQYHKPGAMYELSREQKNELGLVENVSWEVDKLLSVQSKIAEPLIIYWAPRYLLKQMTTTEPDKNQLYHNLKRMKSEDTISPYPNPPTATLLPLRPKSCMPRIRQSPQIILEPPTLHNPQESTSLPKTSPPVGLRRTYAPATLQHPASAVKAKMEENRKRLLTSELVVEKKLKPRIKSAPSTLSRSSSKPSICPQSARTESVKTAVESPPPSRPSTAGSSRSDVASSAKSEFVGGRRMEALLNALHHERESGGFFQKFVERSGNKLWDNCLSFWQAVQEYHLLFYAEVIDPYIADRKARAIYSQYVVVAAPRNIGCGHDARVAIYKCLDPPFEDLFDDAEEYALSVLYVAFVQMTSVDMKTYGKVSLIEVKHHLKTRSKYVLNLQKRGLITEQFLAENYASMDLLCWMDIEHFRRMPQNDEKRRDEKAKEIKNKYLNKKYFFGPSSPAGQEGQDKVMAAGGGYGKLLQDRPPNPVILEAQKYVAERLERKWLPLFLATQEFAERQKPKAGMDDVVDDVLVQKKKKSAAVRSMLESKWVSSSKDIIVFRKALLNPITALQFRRYVSIKGDSLENDVLFWLEVQRFKVRDLSCPHSDSLVPQKIMSIIGCFIESTIPPALQIDIPPELAEKIAERKHERNPYIFREAQLIVFRYLFGHWNDFVQFRSNLADEKILPTIERRRRHAKIKERQRQKEMEDRAAREAERRAALGLPPEIDEDDENFHDPFASYHAGSQEDEDEAGTTHGGEKDKISWSYSSYMAALQQEDILNNTDESTFSSLMSDTGKSVEDRSIIKKMFSILFFNFT
ncbi:hypothetical protein FSP39_023074, partial [Pinctada imbricata]